MASNVRYQGVFRRLIRPLLLGGFLLLSSLLAVSYADVTLDGSLGPKGPLAGPNYVISHDLGQVRGSNLFHSFGQFNVLTGESATFTGPNKIENILGRVTGGSPSSIDGLIRSTIPEANLFLLNPSGVLFGPNATLDVGGSFHVSTADFLRLADGEKFYANLSDKSVLTVASPAAFGFLSGNPAPISIQESVLKVPEGQTLSVVGGKITLQGKGEGDDVLPQEVTGGILSAPGGQVNLASVASAGELVPNPPGQAPDLTVESFERLGEMALSDRAEIDVSGKSGGSVLIRGGRLVMDHSTILAETLESGVGKDIDIEVGSLTLNGGAQINASSYGVGQGGNLKVTATDSVSISGQNSMDFSALVSDAFDRGSGGMVSLSAPSLIVEDGGMIRTITYGEGDAGSIQVEVGSLTLRGTAGIDAQSAGAGRGGNLKVSAAESVSIYSFGFLRSDSGITYGSGAGGHISLSTPFLLMDAGLISTNTRGEGNAGDIELEVGSLTLKENSWLDTSSLVGATGQAGNLTVTATDSVSISRSLLGSTTFGRGVGGTVSLSAPSLILEDGGMIHTATVWGGNAGNIKIEAGGLTLRSGSVITSENRVGAGQGGNIQLKAGDVQLSDGSRISAESTGTGDAGSIRITAQDTFKSRNSRVTTKADLAGGERSNCMPGRWSI